MNFVMSSEFQMKTGSLYSVRKWSTFPCTSIIELSIKKNSLKNMNLTLEERQFSEFYLDTHKNECTDHTRKFCGLRETSRNDSGSELFQFDSNTKDHTGN